MPSERVVRENGAIIFPDGTITGTRALARALGLSRESVRDRLNKWTDPEIICSLSRNVSPPRRNKDWRSVVAKADKVLKKPTAVAAVRGWGG